MLVDDAGKEGYSLEYTFTVIGWNDANLNAVVDHGVLDANEKYVCSTDGQTISDNFISVTNFDPGLNTTTALSSFFSFIQNNAFAGSKTVAVLPRGFGFAFFPTVDFSGIHGDHHLLQLGYNLDHSEIFAEANKKYSKQYVEQMNAPVPTHGISHVDSGFVSWNTYAILKDNDTRRNYSFVELVSAMGGNDVGVIQPPFSFLPSESDPNCGSVGSPRTEQVVIENIPFRYAIPMLTGWDLEYPCSDHHVKEVGVWIDGWSYNPSGTLSYTLSSVLRDNSNNTGGRSHRVTILGFRPVPFK